MTGNDTMNPRERLFAALDQKGIDRVPVIGVLQTGIVQLMESSGAAWPEAHRDPEIMAKLAWAAHEVGGLEAARIPFDVYIQGEAIAAKSGLNMQLYKWKKDNQPMVQKHPVEKAEDVDKLQVPDPRRDGRMPLYLKAAEILSARCKQEKLPLLAQVLCAFSETNVGLINMMVGATWLRKEPDLFLRVAKISFETGRELGKALVESGVDVLVCNGGVDGTISLDDYMRFSYNFESDLMHGFRKLGAYTIFHCCSDSRHMIHKQIETGMHGFSVSQVVTIAEIRKMVGDKIALCGNVNPLTLPFRKPEEVVEESKACIRDGTDVLTTGCGFGPKTPLANMKAMVQAAKTYGSEGRLAQKR